MALVEGRYQLLDFVQRRGPARGQADDGVIGVGGFPETGLYDRVQFLLFVGSQRQENLVRR